MFYLKNFYKISKKFPGRAGLFIVSTLLLLTVLGNKNLIDKNSNIFFPSHKEGAFFYALINGKENIGQISRKIKGLPGVYKVNILKKKDVSNKVKQILGTHEIKGLIKNLSLDYFGLKVIYEKNIDKRSLVLIRDYLKRFVGKKKITLGSIQKNNKDNLRKDKYLTLIKTNLWICFSIIAFFIWSICFILFGKVVTKMSYIIEQYQRKKFVKVKIISLGNVLIFFLVAGNGIFLTPNWMVIFFGALIIQIISFLYLRRAEWEG